MDAGRGAGEFREIKERHDNYTVYDVDGDKIGTVETTYVNEANQREYIAVSGGLSGLIPGSKANLIPIDLCTVDNNQRAISVSADKDAVKSAPALGGSTGLTSEYEAQVRDYYRLGPL